MYFYVNSGFSCIRSHIFRRFGFDTIGTSQFACVPFVGIRAVCQLWFGAINNHKILDMRESESRKKRRRNEKRKKDTHTKPTPQTTLRFHYFLFQFYFLRVENVLWLLFCCRYCCVVALRVAWFNKSFWSFIFCSVFDLAIAMYKYFDEKVLCVCVVFDQQR